MPRRTAASRRTPKPASRFNLSHERVDYWVDRFSTGDKRGEFELYLSRKPQYEAMIESGFNPEAHSAALARGIWQMIPDTARRYGLRVDETVDERLDPEKSTAAALAYLTEKNRVGRIMVEATGSERGSDADYYRIWDLLPGETRDFVPVMIAAATIGKEPARYGF